MKFKSLFLLLVIAAAAFGWGEDGHKLITKNAVRLLPAEMKFFKNYEIYLIEHSLDADKRRKDDPSEFPKHFIDIDFYEEFNQGRMPINRSLLTEKYGDSVVTQMGILPWVTLQTFENLTKALKEKNRDKILILSADLAHYVEDGHQPMHTVLNYDGQLTGQKGLHARYESKMVTKYLDEIKFEHDSSKIHHINNPLQFIFSYITDANSLNPVIMAADNHAGSLAGSKDNDEYYRLLWFRTEYLTNIQIQNASNALASLLFTAWINAGKPSLNDIN